MTCLCLQRHDIYQHGKVVSWDSKRASVFSLQDADLSQMSRTACFSHDQSPPADPEEAEPPALEGWCALWPPPAFAHTPLHAQQRWKLHA